MPGNRGLPCTTQTWYRQHRMKTLIVVGLILVTHLMACQTTAEDPCEGYPMPETLIPFGHASDVQDKYRTYLWDQPGVVGFGPTQRLNAQGEKIDGYVLEVRLKDMSDQLDLPEDQRIPCVLDGVPVRFKERVDIPQLAGDA